MSIRAGRLGSLEGQTVLLVVATVLALHASALVVYLSSASRANDEAFARRIAAQLILAMEVMGRRPVEERDAEARALSSHHFEMSWSTIPAVRESAARNPLLWALQRRLIDLEPALGRQELHLGTGRVTGGTELAELQGTLALADGTFLNFRSDHAPNLIRLGPWVLIATAMAVGVGTVSVLFVHRVAAPLRELASATGEIGRGVRVHVREAGPDETRSVARALNTMQDRVQRLIDERTQALGAVSHDLRTPITRLRLRADLIEDAATRACIGQDLADMEAMIQSTLAYLRGADEPETPRVVNLAALLSTLVDEVTDAGHPATYEGPGRALACVRAVGMKRAFSNLLDNAVKHGGGARASLITHENRITIRVDDSGAGVPDQELERLFEPFFRLDASRNQRMGGTGLGLTIARKAIERDGGTIRLQNRPEGGLRAEVSLPAPQHAAFAGRLASSQQGATPGAA